MGGAGAAWPGHLGMRGMRAGEDQQRDAHSRNGPQGDGHGGDRHSGIGADAGPAQMPDRRRKRREPCGFCAPGYPVTMRHRIPGRGGTAAQDPLPKFGGDRSQRQQAWERCRAQRAPSVMGARLALLDVPDDQGARLIGQLPIPVGQQLPQPRAGLPPGKRDVQRTESFLQPTAGADGLCMRPAP
jgi:hypothetical protein